MFTRSRRVQQSAPVVVSSVPSQNLDKTLVSDSGGVINAYVLQEDLSTSGISSTASVTVVVSANQDKPVVFTSSAPKPRPPTSLDLLRPVSPDEGAPDTPTITKILLSTLDGGSGGVQCGVPTLTTPTLTPTTLKNITQTFLQASSSQGIQPPEHHSNQAGFVPPIVNPQPGNTFISIDSKSLGGGIATLVETAQPNSSIIPSSCDIPSTITSSTGGSLSGPPPPLLPITGIISSSEINSAIPGPSSLSTLPSTSIISVPRPSPTPSMPSVSITVTGTDAQTEMLNLEGASHPPVQPARRTGGRRPNNRHEKLSDEEEQKRMIRRERNKMAAARCRKRRLDQTITLQDETDLLEAKKNDLQSEIQILNLQKEELEFLLKHHKRDCTRKLPSNSISSNTSMSDLSSCTALQAPAVSSFGPINKILKTTHSTTKKLPPVKREYQNPTPPPFVNSSVTVKEEKESDTDEYTLPDIPVSLSTLPTSRLQGQPMPRPSLLLGSTHNATASAYVKDNRVVTVYTTSSLSSSNAKPNRPTTLNVGPLTDIGVSIETPSAGLRGLNFESMMEGGTGLTPVTPYAGSMVSLSTGLTPLTTPIMTHPSASVTSSSSMVVTTNNCAQQVVSSSSDLSSPDSIGSKHLVSL